MTRYCISLCSEMNINVACFRGASIGAVFLFVSLFAPSPLEYSDVLSTLRVEPQEKRDYLQRLILTC